MQSSIFEQVKAGTNGQAVEFLTSIGEIPAHILDGKNHPCPRCGGNDRFSLVDRSAGAVLCRKCFDQHNGDFIAAIAWNLGIPPIDAARKVASRLGILKQVDPAPTNAIEAVERAKSIPRGWLARYGATIADGKFGKVARVPMFDAKGDQVSYIDLTAKSKGYCAKGKPRGLFLPCASDGKPIKPTGEIVLVEGCKDAAALHSLGFFAIGLPGCDLSVKHAEISSGCNVILFPDLDQASFEGAERTAARIYGIADSIRTARPPGEVKASDGNDVRDHLKRLGGEAIVRQAIADAKLWEPKEAAEGDISKYASLIANAMPGTVDDGEGGQKETLIPMPLGVAIVRIRNRTGDWPRRVDDLLFVHDDKGISFLKGTASLFGYLSAATGVVEWHRFTGCPTKEETFQELRRAATRYTAIETLPHEPKIPDHYYACEFPEPGDGEFLQQLLDRFCPATPTDRDLIQAFWMTLFAGLPPGTRPAFVINGPSGRGIGKSKLVEMTGELSNPPMQFDAGDQIHEIKQRLLSPDSMQQRVAWLDNVKSHRFSWAELEGMITSPAISGKRMYCGDAARPNTLTWCITLNGIALSTDMAQRSVMIELDKPSRSGNWEEETRSFIRKHKQQIIGDIIGELQREPFQLAKFSRWATWEREILQRLPDPAEAQKVITERQAGADVEAEEAGIIEEYFANQLRWVGINWQESSVSISRSIAWNWYKRATGESVTQTKSSRILNQLIDEGRLPKLSQTRTSSSRGFLWNQGYGDRIDDLEERIAKKIAETEAGREAEKEKSRISVRDGFPQ